MCSYHTKGKHFTQDDRIRIEAYLNDNKRLTDIALILHADVSSISREIKKVKLGKPYCAKYAQKITVERRSRSKVGCRKISNNLKLSQKIEKYLIGCIPDNDNGDYFPEVISNTICKGVITHPTIYKWIREERRDLIRYLPKQGKKYRKYGPNTVYGTIKATNPRLISERPKYIEKRKIVGHFEGDTIRGGKVKAFTLVERKSRFILSKINRITGMGDASSLADDITEILKKLPTTHRKTITFDQGSEFCWWDDIEKNVDGLKIYFAEPHSPWQRGTNERSNGLERRFFPKGTDFDTISDEKYASRVWMINHRPRKILNWRTPCEVFGACCNSSFN